MTICLINLIKLDPPNNGGVSRIAKEVSSLLIEESRRTCAFNVVFAVSSRFSHQFRSWLKDDGSDFYVIPTAEARPIRPILAALNPDLIISPLFGGQPFSEIEGFRDIPHIVGMPDTLALDIPHLFSSEGAAQRRQIYKGLKRCSHIVTISEFSRKQIVQHLQVPETTVSVVPLNAELFQSPSGESEKCPIEGRYIFYPANNWPHKRHTLLFQTMQEVWKRDPDLKLVLSGSRSTGFDVSIKDLIHQYDPPTQRIIDLGFVSDQQINSLYKHAEAMVFVSQYEGFGMPLIEAMKNGCPVICAPVSAIPEVAGDAAIYVDSDQPDAWASALLDTLPAKRADLIEKGIRNTSRFSWAQTKESWLATLRKAGLPEQVNLSAAISPPLIPLGKVLEEFTTSKLPYMETLTPAPLDFERTFEILHSYIQQEDANKIVRIPIIGRAYRAFYRLRHLPGNWTATLNLLRGMLAYQIQIEREISAIERDVTNQDGGIRS